MAGAQETVRDRGRKFSCLYSLKLRVHGSCQLQMLLREAYHGKQLGISCNLLVRQCQIRGSGLGQFNRARGHPLLKDCEIAVHSCFQVFQWVEKGLSSLCSVPQHEAKNSLPCLRHHLIQHPLFCLLCNYGWIISIISPDRGFPPHAPVPII